MIRCKEPEIRSLTSVIIPTHNRGELLIRAVESVFAQTHANLEIIIADDNSVDSTPEVCRKLEERDPRVRIYRSDKNVGAAAVRNCAIELCRGQYVCFLDDDDEWCEDKLACQLPLIDQYSIVGCLSRRVDGYVAAGGWEIHPVVKQPKQQSVYYGSIVEVTLDDIFFNNGRLSPSCVMVKRCHLEEVAGFDKNLPSSQGRDLFVRLVNRYGEAALITTYLAKHYQRHGMPRITTTKTNLVGGWMELKKHQHLMTARARAWRSFVLCMKEAKYATEWAKKFYWVGRSFMHVRPWRIGSHLRVMTSTFFLR